MFGTNHCPGSVPARRPDAAGAAVTHTRGRPDGRGPLCLLCLLWLRVERWRLGRELAALEAAMRDTDDLVEAVGLAERVGRLKWEFARIAGGSP